MRTHFNTNLFRRVLYGAFVFRNNFSRRNSVRCILPREIYSAKFRPVHTCFKTNLFRGTSLRGVLILKGKTFREFPSGAYFFRGKFIPWKIRDRPLKALFITELTKSSLAFVDWLSQVAVARELSAWREAHPTQNPAEKKFMQVRLELIHDNNMTGSVLINKRFVPTLRFAEVLLRLNEAAVVVFLFFF